MADTGVEGEFSDAGGHAYGIERVVALGIDSGCGGGLFCSAEPISRAVMAAWLYRAAALVRDAPTPPPAETAPVFEDEPAGVWWGAYAQWAEVNDIIAAPGMVFDPDGTITRAQAAVMFTAAFEHLAAVDHTQGVFADTADISQAAVMAIEGIHAAGLTQGCAASPPRYCPHQPITRAQTATMLARAIQKTEPTVGLTINEPQAARGYTIINTYAADEVHLIDQLGRQVHTWKLEDHWIEQAELLENGNLMIRHESPEIRRGSVSEVDQAGNIIWQYTPPALHHDFLKLPNGNVLLLGWGNLTPQEATAAGAIDPTHRSGQWWRYAYLQEVQPTGPNSGEVVWEWSTIDHLIQDHDPTKPNYGPVAGHPGRIDVNYTIRRQLHHGHWFHMNSIDYDPVLDQIMLSPRNYSELWIIDHNTTTEEAAGTKGDLLYRWGNPRAYDAGDHRLQQLFWPHAPHWIPPGLPGEGNVLIFNNGNERDELRRNYSSIEEITLPAFQNGAYPPDPDLTFEPARAQWNYTAPNPADFYSNVYSGIQRLPNGNTLVCSGNQGIVFQVTPDGTTVWKYVNPVQRTTTPWDYAAPPDNPLTYQGDTTINPLYRAPWYPPDHPGLKNFDLTPKGPLEHYR